MTAPAVVVVDVPGIGKVRIEALSPAQAEARVHAGFKDLVSRGGNHRPRLTGQGMRQDWIPWEGIAYTECLGCGRDLGGGREQARGLHDQKPGACACPCLNCKQKGDHGACAAGACPGSGRCETFYRMKTTGSTSGGVIVAEGIREWLAEAPARQAEAERIAAEQRSRVGIV